MKEMISIFIIAVALSMDTFSLSMGIGTSNPSKKRSLFFSILVGCMHFIMPLLGTFLGQKLVAIFTLKSNFLLGIILIYLAITMLIEVIHPDKNTKDLKIINMFLLAISVSIDSFSTGLGLSAITNNRMMAVVIFSITSFCFTYVGLFIGKYANKLLGTYATILGAVLLLVIGLFHLCRY